MNEEANDILAKLVMLIGTEHEHLSFKDVFEISETILNVVEASKENK